MDLEDEVGGDVPFVKATIAAELAEQEARQRSSLDFNQAI
jgi:hypothetical protein